ncbi:AraC family transcriptional regulator [Herbaspirillum lusitanum]|uniref:AraC family transcriptional regulator n=1 Tax=Herbaspirillum lusitanum TaxID=213312 RepID=A0ABW9AAY9_9BURK
MNPSDPDYASTRMIALIRQLAPQEGYTMSALECVRFMRADRPLARTPVLYEPGIVIVCQGRKRGFLGDEEYVYDARHYLVLSVPLPFSSETEATPEEPLLALFIRLDMTEIADLVLTLDQAGGASPMAARGMIATPLEGALADATLRLLEALSRPLEAAVLGPAIVREICFRVLMGEQGGSVRAALAHQGQFGKISRALRRIHSAYAEALDVSTLADEAGMSVPAFHAHFKSVTHTSPIQYIKSTRLHEARLMMIRDDLTAAAAAARVGYESPSQFGREFKRFFGRSPGDEVREMKSAFELAPAQLGGAVLL